MNSRDAYYFLTTRALERVMARDERHAWRLQAAGVRAADDTADGCTLATLCRQLDAMADELQRRADMGEPSW